MRIMYSNSQIASQSTEIPNPLFLEDEVALAGEANGSLRAATDEEITGLGTMLARLLAERVTPSIRISQALLETQIELESATRLFGPFHSVHEAYGVIMEEIRELEEHVFMQVRRRNLGAMRKEACQLAAMAIRTMVDCCGD